MDVERRARLKPLHGTKTSRRGDGRQASGTGGRTRRTRLKPLHRTKMSRRGDGRGSGTGGVYDFDAFLVLGGGKFAEKVGAAIFADVCLNVGIFRIGNVS